MRAYFHLKDRTEMIRDLDGIEIPDAEEARVHAIEAIRERHQEDRVLTQDWSGWSLSVADASGRVLFTLELEEIGA
jgi:hypothetical protein